MATPLSMEMPAKSPSNKDKGLMKKLKRFDGLAVSMGNGNAKNGGGDMNGSSQRFVHIQDFLLLESSSGFLMKLVLIQSKMECFWWLFIVQRR